MAERADPSGVNGPAAYGFLLLGAGAIFFRAQSAWHSTALSIGLLVASASFIGAVLWRTRHRAGEQVLALTRSGRVELDASLDFGSLPGRWPELARETLNPAGASNTPALPVRLLVDGGSVVLVKVTSWGAGRTPFRAEVPLGAIAAVEVGRSFVGVGGSSITLALRDGGAVRLQVPLRRDRAEVVAGHLRSLAAGASRASDGGLSVVSPTPPTRTGSGRAFLLLLGLVPLLVAAVADSDRSALAALVLGALVAYALLWLILVRPPGTHRRLGIGLVVAAVAFAIDGLVAGELWRLGGTVVAGVQAWWYLRLPAPSHDRASSARGLADRLSRRRGPGPGRSRGGT